MATYSIEIYKLDLTSTAVFRRIDIIDAFDNLRFTNKLNGVGGCSFDIPVRSLKATNTNLTRFSNQVVIKRDNVIVWFGPIVKRSGSYENIDGVISVECQSYLYHLMTRYTDKLKQYTQIAQSTIAYDLIYTSEIKTNGDLKIAQGTLASGNLRDRTYEYKSIGQALIDLSAVNGGIDFELQAVTDSNNLLSSINFNTYYPQIGSLRTDLPSLTFDNVKSFQFVDDGEVFNDLVLEGAGFGDVIRYTTSNPYSQIGFTRREAILQEKDISVYDTLQRTGDLYLNNNAVNSIKIDIELYPSVKPLFTDLLLGDTLKIETSFSDVYDSPLTVSRQGRIIEIGVAVDKEGTERIVPRFLIF